MGQPIPISGLPVDIATQTELTAASAAAASATAAEASTRAAAIAAEATARAGTVSATIPPTPADADTWVYPVSSGGTWRLRYRTAAGGSYKWEYQGGPELEAYKGGAGSIAGNAAYVDASDGAGPTLTIPFAGDYRIEYGARFAISAVWLGLSFNGAAPNALFRILLGNQAVIFSQVFTGLTAGTTIKLQYQFDTAVSSILDRFVRATPVRVG